MPHRHLIISIHISPLVASSEICSGTYPQPQPNLQASHVDSGPTRAAPHNTVPVKATEDKRVARPQRCQAPQHHTLTFGMERYLNEAPQKGGPTYGLVHADLESRLDDIARALCDR